MKALDLVKEYFPSADNDMAQDVLWCCTGWPHFFQAGKTTEESLREQLSEIAQKSGGDPFVACCIADQEMSEAFERGRRERINEMAYLLWEHETGGQPVSDEVSRQYWERAKEMVHAG